MHRIQNIGAKTDISLALPTGGYLSRSCTPQVMAESIEVVERSININDKLGPKLLAAAEQNAILRIGWNPAGDKVPKNGELGLCPALPKGSRMRGLGVFGSWIASYGQGGAFTIQGDAGSFLGAANDGNTILCERMAGNHAGYAMRNGRITILDGVGNDAGAKMTGGLIVIRGSTGSRIGGGMSDGLIVVHGDVGSEPGSGMTGGRIVINGRCPTPPSGVSLRPLTAKEVKDINSLLGEADLEIPKDAVCLIPSTILNVEGRGDVVSSGDLTGIGLVPSDEHQLASYSVTDTIALIGERNGKNTPIALPLPLLPIVPSGKDLHIDKNEDAIASNILSQQPFITLDSPRPIDIVMINSENLPDMPRLLSNAGGIAFDLDDLPAMNSEEMDGMLVATTYLVGYSAPVIFIQGLGRIQALHVRSSHHNTDLAVTRIEDGSGLPESASLPLIGRSSKSHLEGTVTQAGILLGFSADGHDLAILKASGISVICCEVPMVEATDLANWLSSINTDITTILRRLGLSSIDELKRTHLRALDHETAAVSGLRLAGYERPLPHWFAR